MSKPASVRVLLNSIALDPNRWTATKTPYFRLVELLPAIARYGFDALEIWQYHVDGLSASDLEAIRSRCENLKIETPVLGIYPSIHLEGEDRSQEIDHIVRLMETASFLGADTVKLFVGSVASGRLDSAGLELSIAFLQEMAGHAADRGIRLTGETHANTLFDTVESTLRTLDCLDPSTFGVCFQPYDANLAGATGAFTALRDRIWHLHYQGRKEGAISLLEEADLDYGRYTDFIRAQDFEGYLCIEFVKDCVVSSPDLLDVDRVLTHASTDRAFVASRLEPRA